MILVWLFCEWSYMYCMVYMIKPNIIISNKYNVGNHINDFMLREKVTGDVFIVYHLLTGITVYKIISKLTIKTLHGGYFLWKIILAWNTFKGY